MWLGVDFFLAHRVYVANSQHRLYFTYNGGPVFDFSAARKGIPDSAAPEPSVGNIDADSFARRAAALLARGDVIAALAEYTRARAAAPDNADYALGRAQARLAGKDAGLARADLDDAIRLDPRQVGARIVRSRLAIYAHDRGAALVDLDAADKSMPKEADTRLMLGELYIAIDAFAPAIRQFDQWLDTHPSDIGRARALNDRCWARALANETLAPALADCNAALRARRDANFLDSRGLVHLRLGQWESAVADYDAALATRPKSPWSLYGRGIAELRLGRSGAGQADLVAAAALAPICRPGPRPME